MKYGVMSLTFISILTALLALGACSRSQVELAPSTISAASPDGGVVKVNSLAVNPAEVKPEVQILIAANVTNTGTADDKYSGKIRIDNVTQPSLPTFLFSPEETVPGGANRLLSVTTTITNPGTYQVTWGDVSRGLVVNPDEAQAPGGDTNSTLVNVEAPDFSAVDVVTGKTISLNQFTGTPILLNFVNYGCNPDLNNIVSAQLLAIKLLKQRSSDFIPVSVFCGCCPPEVLRQFAEQNNVDWPWILDTDYSIAAKYGNYIEKYGYPTLVFIEKGMVISEYTGAIDFSTLTNKVNSLLTK